MPRAQTIPLTTRTLGRAVSVLDYEDFARAFSGIAKAQAQVLQVARRRHRRDHAGGAGGRTADRRSPVWLNLLAALKASGDPACRRDAARRISRARSASG